MQNYCTLFDSNYATRGLALHGSLEMNRSEFILYVLCMDDLVYEKIESLSLASLVPIRLDDFLNEDLKRVRTERTRAEFCWTCTPYVIEYTIQKYNLPSVTYLDADIMFFSDPEVLHREFEESQKSVLITEHRFCNPISAKYVKRYGRYCVQFMTFLNRWDSLDVLNRWKGQCLEFCCGTPQEGMLGDQKYLDDWAERYDCVHVLEHLGGGVAPWNVLQYSVSSGPKVDQIELVFYHFQNLRLFKNGTCDGTVMPISKSVGHLIYEPYFSALKMAKQCLSRDGEEWEYGYAEKSIDWHRNLSKVKQLVLSRLCGHVSIFNRLANLIA